jgi:hypothetical protein
MTQDELAAIELKAYQIWDREGRPHGRHEEHWQQALRELGLERPQDNARTAIASHDWGEDDNE